MELIQGLPQNLEAERAVLGSILLDCACFPDVQSSIKAEDFSTEKHRRIFRQMEAIYADGGNIDRITIYSALKARGELESCDGLTYLVSLDDTLPRIPNLDSYVKLIADSSTLRRAIFTAQHLINRCMAAEDATATILADAQKIIEDLADSHGAPPAWVKLGDVPLVHPGGINALLGSAGALEIPTPWPAVTERLAGLHRGDLFVVAGRPSMGKSIVAMQLVHHAAMHGYPGAVFSLEMSKESLWQRQIASGSRVDAQKSRAGYTNAAERARQMEAAADLDAIPVFVDDSHARTISAITAGLRKLRTKQEIALVVVDHLQLMAPATRNRDHRRNEDLGDIVHALKTEAESSNCVMVLVSQLNRNCENENRRPQLSDLAECGAIEQDADVVMFVHRPERYAKNSDRQDLKGLAEFIVAKQRCGPTGLLQTVFLGGVQRFESSTSAGWGEAE